MPLPSVSVVAVPLALIVTIATALYHYYGGHRKYEHYGNHYAPPRNNGHQNPDEPLHFAGNCANEKEEEETLECSLCLSLGQPSDMERCHHENEYHRTCLTRWCTISDSACPCDEDEGGMMM